MGYVRANISLANPRRPELKTLTQNALVDTGALMLCLPEHIALQLDLQELEKREIITADGRKQLVPYVGPVLIRFENRSCYTGALVLGDEVLLGAVPMEDMDIIISPSHRRVVVNPESPNFPQALVK